MPPLPTQYTVCLTMPPSFSPPSIYPSPTGVHIFEKRFIFPLEAKRLHIGIYFWKYNLNSHAWQRLKAPMNGQMDNRMDADTWWGEGGAGHYTGFVLHIDAITLWMVIDDISSRISVAAWWSAGSLVRIPLVLVGNAVITGYVAVYKKKTREHAGSPSATATIYYTRLMHNNTFHINSRFDKCKYAVAIHRLDIHIG